jgi:hypothetical protein
VVIGITDNDHSLMSQVSRRNILSHIYLVMNGSIRASFGIVYIVIVAISHMNLQNLNGQYYYVAIHKNLSVHIASVPACQVSVAENVHSNRCSYRHYTAQQQILTLLHSDPTRADPRDSTKRIHNLE